MLMGSIPMQVERTDKALLCNGGRGFPAIVPEEEYLLVWCMQILSPRPVTLKR